MTRSNILRTAFGLAIAFGLVFDQPDPPARPMADAADAAAVVEAALAAPAAGEAQIETVAARRDPCAAHAEPTATAEQREL